MIKDYFDAISSGDTLLYSKLVLSKDEMQNLILKNKENYSNCITDSETNYNPSKTINNLSKIKEPNKKPVSIKILYATPIKGCGIIEGQKITISLINDDNTIINRTLTLIRYENTYKIIFDLFAEI